MHRLTPAAGRAAILLAAALPLTGSPALAQLRAGTAATAFQRDALPVSNPLVEMPAATMAEGSRFGASTVLHGSAGALIGGFFGYLLSQVVVSQWEEGDGKRPNRQPYIAGGVVLGAFTGVSVDLWGRPRRGTPGAPVVPLRDRVDVMDREEIASAGATNLYQLVRTRRNQWLVPRGVNSFRDGATSRHVGSGQGSIQVLEGGDFVIVYVDGVKLGGVEKLADLLPVNAERLEFLDPGEATLRFGGGNSHGVILVTSRRPEPAAPASTPPDSPTPGQQ
ncbi:MAG TPA: TonB-dependent receptor plug domain-containing protein [Gemmatimonadales bacterium]